VKNRHLYSLVLLSLAVTGSPVRAASPTQGEFLAQQPMGSTTDPSVKPNIMFLFDDSGSMSWAYLPDVVSSLAGNYGYASSQCNGVYYDPNQKYDPPVYADGTSYAAATWPTAANDGYGYSGGSTNLATSFKAYSSDTSQPAYYYQYNGAGGTSGVKQPAMSYTIGASGTTDTTTTFYQECAKANGAGPAATSTWTKVTVGASEQQNFANWYTYYRTRINTMRTAAGIAFSKLANPDRIRLGFSNIYFSVGHMLHLGDYCSNTAPLCAQRTDFYNRLYMDTIGNNTPTREALNAIGMMYQGTLSGAATSTLSSPDPVKYSCQRNSVVLATDGFWNSQPTAYKGPGLTSVGDQDGGEVRPYRDVNSTPDTMADIAEYYWKTDLRTGAAWTNNVHATAKDPAKYQHMNTFTLGLGADGKLKYKDSYETAGNCPDYDSILAGTGKEWGVPTSLAVNGSGDATHIDDLWHAAVNGRGSYYRASSKDALVNGLQKAFAESAEPGSGGAAATGTLSPTSGDNSVYFGSFNIDAQAGDSSGDVKAFTIDTTKGEIADPTLATPAWSAQTQLDTRVGPSSDTRTIYIAKGPSTLGYFTKADLLAHPSAPIANKWFDAGPTNPNG
jgi:type IV pilus assembly protein PilY1